MLYHETLDQVAQAAGFNHWHHVSESAKAFKPTEQAYYFGVIIAMDVKDAMEFHDPSGSFVEDPFAPALCSDDVCGHIREIDGENEVAGNDQICEEEENEWRQDVLSDSVFFRYTGSSIPGTVEDVVKMVRVCSFFPPEFIWHKGTFQICPSDHALDEDGEIAGIRF